MSEKKEDSFADMFMNFGKGLRLPMVDTEAIVEHHRKNLAALDKAAKAAGSGASAVIERQRAMVQEALQEITDLARGATEGRDPADLVLRQAELARKSFETAIRNASELGGMAAKSGRESVEVIGDRVRESVDEVREFIANASDGEKNKKG